MIYHKSGHDVRTHIYFSFWNVTANLYSLSHSRGVMALIKGHTELGRFFLNSAHQHFTAIISDIMFYYKNTLCSAL